MFVSHDFTSCVKGSTDTKELLKIHNLVGVSDLKNWEVNSVLQLPLAEFVSGFFTLRDFIKMLCL